MDSGSYSPCTAPAGSRYDLQHVQFVLFLLRLRCISWTTGGLPPPDEGIVLLIGLSRRPIYLVGHYLLVLFIVLISLFTNLDWYFSCPAEPRAGSFLVQLGLRRGSGPSHPAAANSSSIDRTQPPPSQSSCWRHATCSVRSFAASSSRAMPPARAAALGLGPVALAE